MILFLKKILFSRKKYYLIGGEKMKRKFIAKLVACAALLAISVNALACSNSKNANSTDTSNNTNSTEASSESKETSSKSEPTTLEFYIMYGGTGDAVEKNWMSDILKEKLNIVVKNTKLAGDQANQKMQALMASGSLPDIVGFNDINFSNNAAAAGLIIPLEDYKDKLPNIFGNPFYKSALDFSRAKESGGKNKVYILPTGVGLQDSTNFNPQLRWDLYEKIGSPKIANLEGYLPVLKQMQDLNPVNAKGQKVYGISIFSDWDSYTMAMASFLIPLYGYDNEYVSFFTETMVDGSGDVKSILDDNSMYKRALKFYYSANKMGIMDPDSLTQKWDNVSEKYKEGRILFSPWEWASAAYNVKEHADADKPTGYDAVWAEDFKIPISPDATVGRTWNLAIGEASKNKDAALKFLDFFYSFEGQDLFMNGPKGMIWEENDKGERYITDTGWDYLDNNKDLPGGGKLYDAMSLINNPAITSFTINPKGNQPMGAGQWESSKNHNPTKVRESWIKANGHKTALDAAKANGQVLKSTQAVNMLPALPDDLQNVMSQAGDVIKTNSWKMVFAKDEEEFEALWKDMGTKSKGLGFDNVITWAQDNWKKALEEAEKYK
jgi:putative aldouronate transport system substrate-binding protein